ncbi:hypothetical protein LTR78_005647 [Recurvomyces mirabilis]|uniref:RWD domain-containing protein n=1 Tax=Recurvomyces mirabilis TaxID=574656 RepID=A0AAE1C184_9PEZI|nr:hypothetical protein LTR78_005647 [Recurvomyces mirabilis]KAK5151230.1 hypothetical protein LTS14_009400 [Recurvomyces mirabilis]
MNDQDDRLSAEVALLESMYPEQLHFDPRAQEVSYKSASGSLQVRLPAGYLHDSPPDILAAGAGRRDLRSDLKKRITDLAIGEEVLDSIIAIFDELCEEVERQAASNTSAQAHKYETTQAPEPKATVVIWLHHLLNTNKRKQALSPPSSAVSGLSKPGYPGVLVYSGPSSGVHEHVNELKQLNWAAFQVRFETDEEWIFEHGTGVKEVEAMKDLVVDVGEARREEFMEAMRMK